MAPSAGVAFLARLMGVLRVFFASVAAAGTEPSRAACPETSETEISGFSSTSKKVGRARLFPTRWSSFASSLTVPSSLAPPVQKGMNRSAMNPNAVEAVLIIPGKC